MNDIDQNWWDIIKPPGTGQTPDPGGLSSPLMQLMQGGGLEKWMQNPRVPGSGGTQAPPAMPQPQAPAQTPAAGGGGYPALTNDQRVGFGLSSLLYPQAGLTEEKYAEMLRAQQPQTGFWG
jgi:hypothetical protein